MSIKWMDDPSFYATAAQGGVRYNTFSVTVVGPGSTNAGRFGTGAWSAGNSAQVITKTIAALTTGTQATSTFLTASPSFSSTSFIAFLDTGTVQVDVRCNGLGQIYVTRNGTTIAGPSTNAMIGGLWYRVEAKVTIDPSAGVVEVRVNGSSSGWIPSTTGLNTRATSNSSFNQIQLSSTISNVQYHNDWVLTDTNSPNANFLGDKRCFLVTPASDSSVHWTHNFTTWVALTFFAIGSTIVDSNGNVQRVTSVTAGSGSATGGSAPTWSTTGGAVTADATTRWTCLGTGSNPGQHNWMAISETGAGQVSNGYGGSDGDDSYNSDATPGDIDLFTGTTLPLTATNIDAVDVVAFVRKDDAGTRTFETLIKSGATQVASATLGLSTSYQYLDFIQETDPNTSAAWTPSGVNGALIGYEEVV